MSGAERKRLFRSRRKAGLRVLRGSLAVDDETIAVLIQRNWVPSPKNDADLLESVSELLDALAEWKSERNAVPRGSE